MIGAVMHIKFLKHGRGDPAAAASYLLDEYDHLNVKRAGVEVLRGDPAVFSALADSLCKTRVWKYSSAVIAWSKDDDPSDEEIERTLNGFESVAFAGLKPSQYHMTAVLHVEKDGAKHVHILAPRCELLTGKSLNIAPPTQRKDFDYLRNYLNAHYGWQRPDGEKNARTLSNGLYSTVDAVKKKFDWITEIRASFIQKIDQIYSVSLESGLMQNREELIEYLEDQKIAKVNKRYQKVITLIPYKADGMLGTKPWKMQGEIYSESFDYTNATTKTRRAVERTAKKALGDPEFKFDNRKYVREPEPELERRFKSKLKSRIASRAGFNQSYFPNKTNDRTAEFGASDRNSKSEKANDLVYTAEYHSFAREESGASRTGSENSRTEKFDFIFKRDESEFSRNEETNNQTATDSRIWCHISEFDVSFSYVSPFQAKPDNTGVYAGQSRESELSSFNGSKLDGLQSIRRFSAQEKSSESEHKNDLALQNTKIGGIDESHRSPSGKDIETTLNDLDQFCCRLESKRQSSNQRSNSRARKFKSEPSAFEKDFNEYIEFAWDDFQRGFMEWRSQFSPHTESIQQYIDSTSKTFRREVECIELVSRKIGSTIDRIGKTRQYAFEERGRANECHEKIRRSLCSDSEFDQTIETLNRMTGKLKTPLKTQKLMQDASPEGRDIPNVSQVYPKLHNNDLSM